jgi:hypothetical protein
MGVGRRRAGRVRGIPFRPVTTTVISVGGLLFQHLRCRMSKGLGKRQRDILAKLAQHRDTPPDYNHDSRYWPEEMQRYSRDRYPEWMTVRELAGVDPGRWRPDWSDVESTRRAVRKLEAAGLVETRYVWRNQYGQRQIGVRLLEAFHGQQ